MSRLHASLYPQHESEQNAIPDRMLRSDLVPGAASLPFAVALSTELGFWTELRFCNLRLPDIEYRHKRW